MVKPRTKKEQVTTGRRVRITLEVDTEFVKLLSANITLRGLHQKAGLDPAECLAVVACAEARGALPEQVHAWTPINWRNNIEAVHAERRVIEDNAA